MQLPFNLQQKLNQRAQDGILRSLKTLTGSIDFCSNDYLGLARSATFKLAVEQALLKYPDLPVGATGSRLLSGNWKIMEELETELALFHATEASLLFNSGFAANTGFFSAVPQRGDTIFYDEASHASIKDGIRLSFAKAYSFKHNNLDDLKNKFKLAAGTIYVVVESLYSMDGDFAPLTALAQLCFEKGAYLIVDEAHSNGLFGSKGEGLVQELNLQNQVFARIMTFGKALGCHGAVVVGPEKLKQYLVNFSRPFIYTTALSVHAILSIQCAYNLLPALSAERKNVKSLSLYLKKQLSYLPIPEIKECASPIHAIRGIAINGLKKMTEKLQENQFDVRPVFSPTVPVGKEQLRIIVHAFNTQEEITELVNIMAESL